MKTHRKRVETQAFTPSPPQHRLGMIFSRKMHRKRVKMQAFILTQARHNILKENT